MSDRVLVKQFNDDAGAAFVEVIKKSDGPVSLARIRDRLVEAGLEAGDVNRKWGTVRDLIKTHPNITKPSAVLYEWSPIARPSQESLQKLVDRIGTRAHTWIVQAHVDNIADSLARAETTGSRAQIGWSEQREQEKATLLAEIVSSAEALAADGQSGTVIVDWLVDQADRRGLTPIGRFGDRAQFDKGAHEPVGRSKPRPGDEVRIVRAGFSWSGTGQSIVVVKALVE